MPCAVAKADITSRWGNLATGDYSFGVATMSDERLGCH